ncbi:MAG: inositol-3-phosphate synthase, partial [Deltaproteobacteria bacterium]|nr:inositol-3-phosphate synthase [Deltaproteobacteria bacterium]
MNKIRIAIVGIGNCAGSLIQGIEYYKNGNNKETGGFMHWDLGGYRPGDIEIAAAFDIDRRKVGLDVAEAIFQPPNCTKTIFPEMPKKGVDVKMGRILDGVAEHMQEYDERYTFLFSDQVEANEEEIVKELKKTRSEILLNYLPVGSEKAVQFYAECALKAGVAFVNNMPVFIASNPAWAEKFEKANVPIIGDDIKSQVGATIVHRVLANLFSKRGVKLDRTYQLNTGGNTDFLNMLDRNRLTSKRKSKTEAVQSQLGKDRLDQENIHIGTSDYVAWQKDNKLCFIRMEGKLFGNNPMDLELR